MGSRPPFLLSSDGSGQKKRLQKVITIINPISPLTVTKSPSSNTQKNYLNLITETQKPKKRDKMSFSSSSHIQFTIWEQYKVNSFNPDWHEL